MPNHPITLHDPAAIPDPNLGDTRTYEVHVIVRDAATGKTISAPRPILRGPRIEVGLFLQGVNLLERNRHGYRTGPEHRLSVISGEAIKPLKAKRNRKPKGA